MAYTYPQSGMYTPPPLDNSLPGAPGAQSDPYTQALLQNQYTPPGGATDPTQGGVLNGPNVVQKAINPALAASVIGLNSTASQQASIDRQRKMADAMRADAQRQSQGIQAGRVYQGPGWANGLAAVGDAFGAQNLNSQANQATTGLDKQRQDALTQYFNALTGGGGSSNQ
jgi:hypothetical protein